MDTKESIVKEKLMSLFHIEHRMSFGRGTTTSIQDLKKLGGRESLLSQLCLSADYNKNMQEFSHEEATINSKSKSASLISRRIKNYSPEEAQQKSHPKDRSSMIIFILFISTFYCMSRWRESWGYGFVEALLIAIYFMKNNLTIKNKIKSSNFQIENVKSKILVKRGFENVEISTDQLLVGDIIDIKGGQECPADLILIEGEDICVNEHAITDDSNELEKQPLPNDLESIDRIIDPFILNKSKIIEGEGKGMVCALGSDTVYGQSNYIHQSENIDLIKNNISIASEYSFRFILMLCYICFTIVNIRYVYLFFTENSAYKKKFYNMHICINCVVVLCYLIIVNFPTCFRFSEWLVKLKCIKQLDKYEISISDKSCFGKIGNLNELIIEISKVFPSDTINPESIFYDLDINISKNNDIIHERDISNLSQYNKEIIQLLACALYKYCKKANSIEDSPKILKVFNTSLLKFLKINDKSYKEYSKSAKIIDFNYETVNSRVFSVTLSLTSDPKQYFIFSIILSESTPDQISFVALTQNKLDEFSEIRKINLNQCLSEYNEQGLKGIYKKMLSKIFNNKSDAT